jgi:dolichol-phosphate mannosyltransferase
MSDTLVVVPTYDEKENVRSLSEAILRVSPQTDLLFVDDNSPDGTGEMLDALAAQDRRIQVLHRERKMGLGRAYVEGFRWALEHEYGFVFEMDADFSHNPADVPRLRAAAETADLVLGSRFAGGIRVVNWPLSRLILSKGAAMYVRWITGLPLADPTGGFKCYRRAVIESMRLDAIASNGYSFQIETAHHAWINGFRVVEIPITFEERRLGQSKMNARIVREALWVVWRLAARCRFRRRPAPPHSRSVARTPAAS